jgi:hypothetical protein
MAASLVKQKSWVAATDTKWPAKPKIFSSGSLEKKNVLGLVLVHWQERF